MAQPIDPTTAINLALCVIIVILSCWSAKKIGSNIPFYIGIAFGLFGISHFATFTGVRDRLEPYLIVIRTLAYIFVIIGVFVTVRTVLRRKEAEQSLRENEDKYQALFDAELDAVYVIEKETGRIQDANAAAEHMFGYTHDEFTRLNITDLSTEPEKTLQSIKQTQITIPLRYHKKKDGTVFPVEITANMFLLNGRDMMVAAVRDITERRKAEEALKESNKKLNLMNRVTRHDILNQLTSLIGYLELLKEKTSNPSLLRLIQGEERAAETIERQINFTRDYQDIGIQSPQWQNLRTVAGKAATHLDLKGTALIVDVDDISVYADPLLEKVLHNLVENALRHGGSLTTIRLSSEKTDQGLVLICADDGIGIPVEEKESIFERRYGKHGGYGLYLSREILSITGIRIHETGEPGKGARFEIRIPKGAYRFADIPEDKVGDP
jgi:PAS domain S-box-containing protein